MRSLGVMKRNGFGEISVAESRDFVLIDKMQNGAEFFLIDFFGGLKVFLEDNSQSFMCQIVGVSYLSWAIFK